MPLARHDSPPLSFLLPSFGTIGEDSTAVNLSKAEEWYFYFYLTIWPRFFFPNTPRAFLDAWTHMGFPAAERMALWEAQWSNPSVKEGAKEFGNIPNRFPPLPRVMESRFGQTLRRAAVGAFLSSTSSLVAIDGTLDELLHDVLTKLNGGHLNGSAACALAALQAVLSPHTNASAPHALLFHRRLPAHSNKATAAVMGMDDTRLCMVHRSRLFAALAVETFGRVKSVCARLLLAYIHHGNPTSHSANQRMETEARAWGVVMGIMESAMAYERWRYDRDGTGRCPLSAAACLLHALVDLTPSSSASSPEAVEAVSLAWMIVSTVQELLFVTVAGGPLQESATTPGLGRMFRPLAGRGLVAREVDALVQYFLPALLQQMGWEWPWSESLRRARQLDKVPLLAQDGAEVGTLRLTSQAVFTELLAVLGRRTYANRLRRILPPSFDTFLDALFPDALTGGNGSHSTQSPSPHGTEATQGTMLFTMPPYYRVAGEALLEFFKRSSLGETSPEETERILQRSTDVLPMMVQLQALGTRGHSANETTTDTEKEEEEGSVNETTASRLRHVRLSEKEKGRLVLRYRCEVLLAAVITHTQLRTVSQVQQLMRQLSPLFEKLLLPLLHERTLDRPLVTLCAGREHHEENRTQTPVLRFSPEARVLMDDLHYAFYPLEWVPDAVDALLQLQPYPSQGNAPHAIPLGVIQTETTTSLCAHYSLFAAVAHQFGLLLSGTPQGPRGGDGTPQRIRLAAHRFFHTLVLNSLADAAVSSCEAEGAAAVAATRRVGVGREAMKGVLEIRGEGETTHGAVPFHAVVNPHDVILSMAQCLLPSGFHRRADQVDSNSNYNNHNNRNENENEEAESGGCATELLRRVMEWTQSTLATRARQGGDRSSQSEGNNPNSHNNHHSGHSSHVYGNNGGLNSHTFDAIPLSRVVLRAVRRRLLEKMSSSSDPLLRQQLESLQGLLEAIGLVGERERSGSGNGRECTAAELLWGSPLFAHEMRESGTDSALITRNA